MRDISDHSTRMQHHLLPHAVIYDAERGLETKHPRVLFAEEGDGDGHPELDVPLILAHLHVCPVFLHDDSKRGIEHLLRLGQLLLREAYASESAREYGHGIRLGGEAALVCVCSTFNFDRVNRRKFDRRFFRIRQHKNAGPCVQGIVVVVPQLRMRLRRRYSEVKPI